MRISVSDTGIGIADESLEAIFSPFTQADAHISRRFGGTGLGLALCRSLTDAMGGDLTVQSTLGHGSTFSVSIPLATHTQQPGFPKPTPRTVTIWNQSGNLQGAVLEELLTSWGMTCMLIDYQPAATLPAMTHDSDFWLLDSPALAQRLKAVEPNKPRLLICGYRALLTTNKALKLGIRQQVASPPSRRRLAQAIDELFGLFKDTQAPSKTEVSAAGQRLLLVEDNMVNQMVAKGMLSRLGYEVDLAEHGEIALSMLEKAPYSLVLMDCNMPVMDGYEASRRIRADPRWKDLPIIALTANALHEDRQRYQRLSQQCLNIGTQIFRLGSRCIALDYLTLTVDQKLGEVPLDTLAAQQARRLRFKLHKQRVSLVAIYIDLLEQRKANAVVQLTKLGNLSFITRLLRAKLVTRKARHPQPLGLIVLPQGFQPLVLRSETTFARGIDHQIRPTIQFGETAFTVINGGTGDLQ